MPIILSMLGLLLTLVGLLLIGPQVHKHQIRVYSPASWILRGGALLLMVALFLPETDQPVIQVGRIAGVTLMTASLIIVNHEWTQAGDRRQDGYQFKPTVDMLFFFVTALLANIALLIGLAQEAAWADTLVLPLLIWMVLFGIRLARSEERLAAGFQIGVSLSAQIFYGGVLLLVFGTWL